MAEFAQQQADTEISENTRVVYQLYVENWRHYDALVWQIQSIAVALNGFLIAQAFGESMANQPVVRAVLMFTGGLFTFVLWIALVKHLLYQRAQDYNVLGLRKSLGVQVKWFDFSKKTDVEIVMGKQPRIIRWAARQKAHKWLLSIMGFIAVADLILCVGIILHIF